MRSVSSMQSASASRAPAGLSLCCRAISAPARSRVSGVRRSWATLSSASRIARNKEPFRSSKVLNCRTRSPTSSSRWGPSTRADRSPVVTMRCAVAATARTGLMARQASQAPLPADSSTAAEPASHMVRRSGASSTVRLSVLRAICSTAPPGSPRETTARSRCSSRGTRQVWTRRDSSAPEPSGTSTWVSSSTQSSGTLAKVTSPPGPKIRTSSDRTCGCCCSRSRRSRTAGTPPVSKASAYSAARTSSASRSRASSARARRI